MVARGSCVPGKVTAFTAPDEAFEKLNTTFTTATIQKHPDPSKPFIVGVNASETGIEAVQPPWVWSETKAPPNGILL